MSDETFKIGIDVGGTFTDLFVWSSTGAVSSFKVLSTPQDPSIGVVDGLRAIAEARSMPLEQLARSVSTIVHGTTVTTNAVLTRGGARTGLLTTDGVRDALEMRRGIRERQYDNRYPNAVPLVPRHRRRPIRERMDAQGRELTPLDLDGVRAEARRLKGESVQSVAICFLNAFSNPAHEREAEAIVRAELPNAFVCASTEVLPLVRFYNRISTTALNAYVGPVLRDYLEGLTQKLAQTGFSGVLLIMQSNGGVALPEVVARLPASTLLSGPAGGPTAATQFTSVHGASSKGDCILVDMGGTSFDASLVRDGTPAMAHEGDIDRLRIALPMLEITTIGAGGGSIGWIDEGGMLRMGPRSAGAMPGPACYGRGGEEPTCTDANVVLGYLDPGFFAGGKLKLDRERAENAIRDKIGKRLSLEVERAAIGMYRVINANMAHGVREITVKRGLDPREFPLVVAGGAAAVHACMIADELEIPVVLVPPAASILCAAGMLFTDLKHDFVRTLIGRFSSLDSKRLRAQVDAMAQEGEQQLRLEGVPKERIVHEVALDLRYLKQYHELTLPVDRQAIDKGDFEAIAKAFHREHDRLYGYHLEEEKTDLELIAVRVRAIGRTEKPVFPEIPADGGTDPKGAQKGNRRAYVPERDAFANIPVYDATKLRAGNVVAGPALLERADTTLFVSERYVATIDRLGSAHLRREVSR